MSPLLSLGFFLGMRHALDADHVAAVAALATRSPSLANVMRLAAAWGLGHTVTLLVLGSILLAVDASLPPIAGRVFEGGVGVMLVVLGIDVLRRIRKRRIHLHVHDHGDGRRHLHVHAHEHENAHDPARHDHAHVSRLLPRAVVVGTVHGVAGTGAVTLLSLEALDSYVSAIAYLMLFGLGSILGMMLFSVAISVPLRLSARHLGWASSGLEAALGLATIVLGCWMSAQAAVLGIAAG
ncbi:MAG: urease accessory protein [Candidatus Binatia bacterium]